MPVRVCAVAGEGKIGLPYSIFVKARQRTRQVASDTTPIVPTALFVNPEQTRHCKIRQHGRDGRRAGVDCF